MAPKMAQQPINLVNNSKYSLRKDFKDINDFNEQFISTGALCSSGI